MQKSMKFRLSSRIAAATLAFLAVITLSSCNNRNNESVSRNSQGSPSNNSTATSPSESATNSPSSSTSTTAAAQGVAPQGTTCPSGNPIKAVNSKRLGKIALTTNSPEYSKTKPEKCFPDPATAEVAGYKVPK